MKHHSKQTKFIIFLVISFLALFVLIYFINRGERYQTISQPTVTNPNPVIYGYGPYGTETNYMMPYAKPRFAKYIPDSENLSTSLNINPRIESFRFQTQQPLITNFEKGTYLITGKDNEIILKSSAFDPVQCNTISLTPIIDKSENPLWMLHPVSKGIYIFKKPDGKECLYAGLADQLKSYLLAPGCTKNKNVCGLESLDYEKKLDPESKRTYFEIWNYPEENAFAIRNVENQKFICLMNNNISFENQITKNCLFNITKQ